MKNKIIVLLLIAILIVGCNSKKEEKKENKKEDNLNMSDIDKKVEETLENMTLDEKIGQMIIISYRKEGMDSTLKSAIEEVKPGGFILFA